MTGLVSLLLRGTSLFPFLDGSSLHFHFLCTCHRFSCEPRVDRMCMLVLHLGSCVIVYSK